MNSFKDVEYLYITSAILATGYGKIISRYISGTLWKLGLKSPTEQTQTSKDAIYLANGLEPLDELNSIPLTMARVDEFIKALYKYMYGSIWHVYHNCTPTIPSDQDLIDFTLCSTAALWCEYKNGDKSIIKLKLGCVCQHKHPKRDFNDERFSLIKEMHFTPNKLIDIVDIYGNVYTPELATWESAKLHVMISYAHFAAIHGHNYPHFNLPEAFSSGIYEMNMDTNAYKFMREFNRYSLIVNRLGMYSGTSDGIVDRLNPRWRFSFAIPESERFIADVVDVTNKFYNNKELEFLKLKFDFPFDFSSCVDSPYVTCLRNTYELMRGYMEESLAIMSADDIAELEKLRRRVLFLCNMSKQPTLLDFLSTTAWIASIHHSMDHQSMFESGLLMTYRIPMYSTSQVITEDPTSAYTDDSIRKNHLLHEVFMAAFEHIHKNNSFEPHNLPEFIPINIRTKFYNSLEAEVANLCHKSRGTIRRFPLTQSIAY